MTTCKTKPQRNCFVCLSARAINSKSRQTSVHRTYHHTNQAQRHSSTVPCSRQVATTQSRLEPNRLTSEAMGVIVKASWPSLTSLNLSSNCLHQTAAGFTDGGLAAASILITSQWPQLQALHLSDTHLKPQAVAILTKAPWPALSNFGLSYCPGIDVETVCEAWPLLTSLSIKYCSAFKLHSARCISRLHPTMRQLMLHAIN